MRRIDISYRYIIEDCTLSQAGRLLVMMTMGSWSCLLTLAVSFVLINSVKGTRALDKQQKVKDCHNLSQILLVLLDTWVERIPVAVEGVQDSQQAQHIKTWILQHNCL